MIPPLTDVMSFFVGLHHPSDAYRFSRSFISINRLHDRRTLKVRKWIIDSGAFTELIRHGKYRTKPKRYAKRIKRWARVGRLLAAVTQDYMCEPFILKRTGLSVAEHQRLTIERYDDLTSYDTGGVSIMPVLQGYKPQEYVDHIRAYGTRLEEGAYCGVGSICKRNSSPLKVSAVLWAIYRERPDLKLHGFGLKITSLASSVVRALLYSADSMAWSFAARREGRDANSWREAADFVRRIRLILSQPDMWGRCLRLRDT